MLILQWAADSDTPETGTHTFSASLVLLELGSRREAAESHHAREGEKIK